MSFDDRPDRSTRGGRCTGRGPYRVLLVVRHPVGGIRTFLRYVLRHVDRSRFEFVLLAPELPDTAVLRDELAGVLVDHVRLPPMAGGLRFAAAVATAIARRRFDLVYSQGYTSASCCAPWTALRRVRHVVTSHDVLLDASFAGTAGALRRLALSGALAGAERVHCVSFDACENLLANLPSLARRATPPLVLPNGIETGPFVQAASRDLRSELALSADTFLIGFFGRFMPQKGFGRLVDALALLRSQGGCASPIVLAFGQPQGYIREERARVERMGLADSVRFLPFVPSVASTMKGVDVVAMPSLWEAGPLLAMEAMVAGVPLIGTDCIGLREVLDDTPAVRVPAGDARALSVAIASEMRSPTKAAARAFAATAARRFDVAQQAAGVQRMLLDVLEGNEGVAREPREPSRERVALLNDRLRGGGSERVLSYLSRLLARDDPLFVFDDSDPAFDYAGKRLGLGVEGPPYAGLLHELRALLRATLRLRRAKKRHAVGVCVSQKEGPNLVNVLSGVSRAIVTVHEHKSTGLKYTGLRRWVARQAIRAVYNRAELVVAVSREIADDLAVNFGVPRDRLQVVYNPCDADAIAARAGGPLDATLSPMFDGPSIVTVGRLVRQKGQWHLVRALRRIRETVPDARLIVVGSGDHDEYLRRLAVESGLADCVHFLGYRDDPFEIVHRADVFVLPSLWEGFPACLQEALACGTAVIACDCLSGPRELLDPDGESGPPAGKVRFGRFGVLAPRLDGEYKTADEALSESEATLADAVTALLRDRVKRQHYAGLGPVRAREFAVAAYLEQWRSLLAFPEGARHDSPDAAQAAQLGTRGGNA